MYKYDWHRDAVVLFDWDRLLKTKHIEVSDRRIWLTCLSIDKTENLWDKNEEDFFLVCSYQYISWSFFDS